MIHLIALDLDVFIDPAEIVAIIGKTNGLTLYTEIVLRNGEKVVVTTAASEVHRKKETYG